MQITIDAEFKRLIPALLPEEFKQLEANILQDGCRDPLSVWKTDGKTILLDGHNRFKICENHNKRFETTEIEIKDRDHAKLWIEEQQAGRRNLSEDQLDDIRASIAERRQAARRKESASKAGFAKPLSNQQDSVARTGAGDAKYKKTRTIREIAKETKRPQRELERSLKIRHEDPKIAAMVRSGDISKPDAMKIISLAPEPRKIALAALDAGKDVRMAVREAKKEDYNARIDAAAFPPTSTAGLPCF